MKTLCRRFSYWGTRAIIDVMNALASGITVLVSIVFAYAVADQVADSGLADAWARPATVAEQLRALGIELGRAPAGILQKALEPVSESPTILVMSIAFVSSVGVRVAFGLAHKWLRDHDATLARRNRLLTAMERAYDQARSSASTRL